jgi:hypothetical protein
VLVVFAGSSKEFGRWVRRIPSHVPNTAHVKATAAAQAAFNKSVIDEKVDSSPASTVVDK